MLDHILCFSSTFVENLIKFKPHGIFLSNGPGDPAATGKYSIPIVQNLIKSNLSSGI